MAAGVDKRAEGACEVWERGSTTCALAGPSRGSEGEGRGGEATESSCGGGAGVEEGVSAAADEAGEGGAGEALEDFFLFLGMT